VRRTNANLANAARTAESGASDLRGGIEHLQSDVLLSADNGSRNPVLTFLFVLLVGASGVLAGLMMGQLGARASPERISVEFLPSALRGRTGSLAGSSAALMAAAVLVGLF
jgi:hypothetical protein